MTDSMFHDGHRALQDRFDGRRVADALEKHRRLSEFGEDQRKLIAESSFFFLATAHGQSVDCSFKGGPAGFVRVTGPASLEWPDFDGNSMYRSLGNIAASPNVGLLFIRFDGSSYRLRVNGVAELTYDHPRLADYPRCQADGAAEGTRDLPELPALHSRARKRHTVGIPAANRQARPQTGVEGTGLYRPPPAGGRSAPGPRRRVARCISV